MRIEICIENEFEDFDHEGYYNSIDDAIKALYVLKLYEIKGEKDNDELGSN